MGKKNMAECAYPDCENCFCKDCNMEDTLIRKMLKKRRDMADIQCSKCNAYVPENPQQKTGKFYCLVHLRIGKLYHGVGAPNWCTAGCEYTDKKITEIKLIANALKENKIVT